MKKEIYSVPGFVKGIHDSEKQLIIDHWESMRISLIDFKESVFEIGITYAKKHHVKYWIIDNHEAIGEYSEEVRTFAQEVVSPACAKIGIQVMFVVVPNSQESLLSAKEISDGNASQKGILNIEVSSIQDAYQLIDEILSLEN